MTGRCGLNWQPFTRGYVSQFETGVHIVDTRICDAGDDSRDKPDAYMEEFDLRKQAWPREKKNQDVRRRREPVVLEEAATCSFFSMILENVSEGTRSRVDGPLIVVEEYGHARTQ